MSNESAYEIERRCEEELKQYRGMEYCEASTAKAK